MRHRSSLEPQPGVEGLERSSMSVCRGKKNVFAECVGICLKLCVANIMHIHEMLNHSHHHHHIPPHLCSHTLPHHHQQHSKHQKHCPDHHLKVKKKNGWASIGRNCFFPLRAWKLQLSSGHQTWQWTFPQVSIDVVFLRWGKKHMKTPWSKSWLPLLHPYQIMIIIQKKKTVCSLFQLIGLRENYRKIPYFMGKSLVL